MSVAKHTPMSRFCSGLIILVALLISFAVVDYTLQSSETYQQAVLYRSLQYDSFYKQKERAERIKKHAEKVIVFGVNDPEPTPLPKTNAELTPDEREKLVDNYKVMMDRYYRTLRSVAGTGERGDSFVRADHERMTEAYNQLTVEQKTMFRLPGLRKVDDDGYHGVKHGLSAVVDDILHDR